MSGRQRLPQEELEVHNLLSPSASSTVSVVDIPPGQRHPVANLPNNDHSYSNENNISKINQENLDTFKSMFKRMNTFINKIDDSGNLKNQIRK